MNKGSRYILPIIVVSQFAGTSLWFVGNAILPELKVSLHLNQYALSQVTTAVTFGFISGTLVFAFFTLADRFSPVGLFFISSIAAAFFNASVVWLAKDATTLFLLRFLTGFFISGIYPVGMKIAADWYEKGLGKALGYLVGALVLGTALPHLLKNRDFALPWKNVLYITSGFAIIGGLLMLLFVENGPYRKKSGVFQWNAFYIIFKSKKWRQAAFGYFGHMWELYSFWALVPLMLELYNTQQGYNLNISLWTFLVIASGAISSVLGGYGSLRLGSARIAFTALFISCVLCFISPFIFVLPPTLFLFILFIWGFTVIPDSPQFSTLVAQYAPEQLKGTALTIYNSMGFFIATISLLLVDGVFHSGGFLGCRNTFLFLGIGPLFGLLSCYRLLERY